MPPRFAEALLVGRVGVDLFFVISGFIIAIVSLEGQRFAPAIGWRDFFTRRFTRIVPIMWVAILCFAVVRLAGARFWNGLGYLGAATLLPWLPIDPPHIWTLRQELLFYLIFALTMLGPRWCRWGMLAWLAGCLVLRLDMVPLWGGDKPLQHVFTLQNLGFGAGLGLALLWLRYTHAWRVRLPVDPMPVLLVLTVLSMAVFQSLRIPWIPRQDVVFAALTFLAIHVDCPRGLLRTIGETLGNASYSIYLFHPTLMLGLLWIWHRFAPQMPVWAVISGISVAVTAAGVAIHLMLERPLIAALRRRWRPAKEAPAAR